MRVAIVHEWLVTYAGSERVVDQLLRIWPDADLYCVVDFLSDEQRGFLRGRKPRTSFIQHLPMARRHFRRYLLLMPGAVARFDLSEYELIVTSSHAVAKAARTRPDQPHICYCHTPMRYAWDMREDYLEGSDLGRGLKGWVARQALDRMRRWDRRSERGVDRFVANSHFVSQRIRAAYSRDSLVIAPPVDTQRMRPVKDPRRDHYLVVSRLVSYKRVGVVVQAFAALPDRRLVVIGDGPERATIESLATKNVRILGHQSSQVVLEHMQHARALLFAGTEDFGIAMAEAQACGTPVLAFDRGGARDIVIPHETGLLFGDPTPEAVAAAVTSFEQREEPWNEERIRSRGESFSEAHFRRAFESEATRVMSEHAPRHHGGRSGFASALPDVGAS